MTSPILLDRLLDRLTDATIATRALRDGAAPAKPLRAIKSNLEIAAALLWHIESNTEAERASPYRGSGDHTGEDGAA